MGFGLFWQALRAFWISFLIYFRPPYGFGNEIPLKEGMVRSLGFLLDRCMLTL